MRLARWPKYLHPFRLLLLSQAEKESGIRLSEKTIAAGAHPGLNPMGCLQTHHRSEGVPATLPSLQDNPDEVVLLTHIILEEKVPFALDGGQKDVQISIVVEIRQHSGTTIGYGVDSRHSGDVLKSLRLKIQEERISLESAEREPLTEQELHVLLLIALVTRVLQAHAGRHHVAPEKASGILHGLTTDESVGRVKILPTIVIEVHEDATPGPACPERAQGGADIPEIALRIALEQAVACRQLS